MKPARAGGLHVRQPCEGWRDMTDERDVVFRLKQVAGECPMLAHTFRFILSAVHALREARVLEHRDRATYGEGDRPQHVRQLIEAIDAIVADRPLDPTWMAGFYYNSAIMRIDACHERFLKAMVDAANAGPVQVAPREAETDAHARHLEAALHLASPLAREHLVWVRKEVHKLKHALYGQEPRHARARPKPNDLENALAAVKELVVMMEQREVKAQLAARFGGPPPA